MGHTVELWRVQQSFELEVRDYTPFPTEAVTGGYGTTRTPALS
jgi:hypothetical protein